MQEQEEKEVKVRVEQVAMDNTDAARDLKGRVAELREVALRERQAGVLVTRTLTAGTSVQAGAMMFQIAAETKREEMDMETEAMPREAEYFST